MKKIILISILLGVFSPAHAWVSVLVNEWFNNNGHYCKYDNGAVFVVSHNAVCPLKINT